MNTIGQIEGLALLVALLTVSVCWRLRREHTRSRRHQPVFQDPSNLVNVIYPQSGKQR